MKATGLLGALALAVFVAGGMRAIAESNGPQGMDPRGDPGMFGNGPHGGRGGQPPGMTGGCHGPIGRPPMGLDLERAKQAGATEAQIQTLADFQLEQQVRRIDLQAAADKADLRLGSLMRAKNTDEKTILQAVDALSTARAELFKLDISAMLKEKQVLGDAVMKKLHEMAPPPPRLHGLPGPRGWGKGPADQGERVDSADEMK
jgi:hypothetical protein